MELHGQERVLGLRAEPSAINWAILSGTLEAPILEACDKEIAPAAYGEADALVWLRERTVHIIETYGPGRVAVRFPEPTALGANKNSAKSRCRVEGVIVEASRALALKVVTGALNTFGKRFGSGSAKQDLEKENLRGLDWSKYDRNRREAILVAISLLPTR